MKTNNPHPICLVKRGLAASALLLALTACEKDLPVYDSPDDAINFEMLINSTTGEIEERNYSFVYEGDDVTRDTLWSREASLHD